MIERRKLPTTRRGINHRFVINERTTDEGGNAVLVPIKGYITVGLYDDGTPGEIFVKMDQQGSQVSGFVDAWAISMSFLLQLGMPLAELCAKFKGTRFEPSGNTDNPNIRIALSPIDYIARWLHGRFVDTELFEDAPIEEVEPTCQKCGSARPLHLSRGKMLCDPCASGKAPEAQP